MEPKRPVRRSLGEGGSQKPKRPLFTEPTAHRYSFYGNALIYGRQGSGGRDESLGRALSIGKQKSVEAQCFNAFLNFRKLKL
jgi:hypothetical protein